MFNVLSVFIGGKVKIAFLMVVLVSIGVISYQKYKIKVLAHDNDILTINNQQLINSVDMQKVSINSLEKNLNKAIENSRDLASKIVKIDEEYRDNNIKLNSYRNRLSDVSLKKPSLVESRINRTFDNILHKFEKATNDKE